MKIKRHNANRTNLIFTIIKENFEEDQRGSKTLKDLLDEHKKEYDDKSLEDLFNKLKKEPDTKLKKIEEGKCLFGFVKFYFNYYVIIVMEYSRIAKIGEYIINRADKMKMCPLFTVDHKTSHFIELENKYLNMFKNFEISRQTYFSYNYNITKTLQRNFIEKAKGECIKNYNKNFCNNLLLKSDTNEIIDKDFDENYFEKNNRKNNCNNNPNEFNNYEIEKENKFINNQDIDDNTSSIPNFTYVKRNSELKKLTQNIFLWNHFHIKEFFNEMENKIWCVWFIYGFFEQSECLIYGQRFLVSVIGRRNRKFAGTRYLKRGINDEGDVANDVETEQILEEISTSCPEKPIISSYVHIRGSVPIYWYQEQNGIMPKPDIKVNYTDVFFESTTKHFLNLIERYGEPTIVCNLTKKKEENKQETLLNENYENSVEYILQKLKDEEDGDDKNKLKSKKEDDLDKISQEKIQTLYSNLIEPKDKDKRKINEKYPTKKRFTNFEDKKIKGDTMEFNKFLEDCFNYKNVELFSNKSNKRTYEGNNNNNNLKNTSEKDEDKDKKNIINNNTNFNPRKNDTDNQSNILNSLKDIEDKIDKKIIYCHYDLKQERRSLWFYYNFYLIAYNFTEITNMFSFIPDLRCNNEYLLELQNGIIRSNCVDCLDRTNVFQQVIGTAVMVSQLRLMGMDVKEPSGEDDVIFGALTELYKKMGHTISSQYAGSLAHKQTIKDNRTKINKAIDKIPELFNTCKRYFNNSFNDFAKQSTINLFLGKFRNFPSTELSNDDNKHLWDLLSDNILHKSKKNKIIPKNWVSLAITKYETYSLIGDLFEKYENYLNKKENNNNSSDSLIKIGKDNTESEYQLKTEVIDSIKITKYKNYKNRYIINLSNYNKNKINSSRTLAFTSFGQLDIDPKVNIKNYQEFNYGKLYLRYIEEIEEGKKITTNNNNYRTWTSAKNPLKTNGVLRDDLSEGQENKKPGNSSSKRIKREKIKLKENFSYNLYENKIIEPKFLLKFTFDLDENDQNLIHDFADPDMKIKSSEYLEKDEFLKMEMNKENYNKIFDNDFLQENYDLNQENYLKKDTDEFKEDIKNMLSNSNARRIQIKQRKNYDKDYLIYDVEKNLFYRKMNIIDIKEKKGSFSLDKIKRSRSLGFIENDSNNLIDSPKTIVRIQRLPIKIKEDYII